MIAVNTSTHAAAERSIEANALRGWNDGTGSHQASYQAAGIASSHRYHYVLSTNLTYI